MDELLNGRRRTQSTSAFGPSAFENRVSRKAEVRRPRWRADGDENDHALAGNLVKTPVKARRATEKPAPRTAEARIEKTRLRRRQRLRRQASDHDHSREAGTRNEVFWIDSNSSSTSSCCSEVFGDDDCTSSAVALAEARFAERLRRLEQENAMLRENGRRWKRKYEQEKAVNKELGKRSKRWRAQSEVLENQIKDLEEKLSAQAALLERVSPVSTLHSPQPWWSTTPDSTAGNSAADSPQLSTPLVALRTVDEEGLIEVVGPEQVGSDTTPSNSPLRVNVDRSPPPENTQSTRCELFTHVITIDESKELTSCWPLSARSSVPPNVEQFCFLAGSVSTPASFVFMLSGECSTPLTRGFSCLDNATYGICLSDGTTCECILTKKPLFRLLEQVLRAMYGLGEDDRSAFLSALTESAAKVNVAHVGPGWKFTAVDDQVRWMWPERCVTRLDLFVEWGLPTLLETMPLDQLLFLVGCLLLELKVVLVSSDLRRVTSAAFALLPFLRPCAWVQPFIPLLPPSLSVVCDAPVPVLVGAAEIPSEVQDIDGSMHSPCRDNGRQEAVVVRLDQGRLDLSEALSTSYHALKLPGLSELYLATRDVEDPTVLLRLVQDHVTGLLRACHCFGRSVGNLAVTSSLPSPHAAIEEADQTLASFVPLLKRNLAISPPWQYLARLQTTQLFMQWCDLEASSNSPGRP